MTIGLPIVLLGTASFLVWKFVLKDDHAQADSRSSGGGSKPRAASRAGHQIKVAGDPWSGYSTFRGEPRLAAELAKSDIEINYIDDEKLYDQDARMAAIAKGELDLAVTTLDAFLQHGAKHKVNGEYPGVILWNIDESAGGDAVFVAKGKRSFDDVGPTDAVCFPPGTPSEHLWDFASLSFAHLDNLRADNDKVQGAKDCWEKLQRGKVQVAVLWQPYTAIAQKAGYTKVFATGGQADDIIIDIVVANREYAKREARTLEKLAKAYFKTIDEYAGDSGDSEAHAKFITQDCGEDCAGDLRLGTSVLSGIDFLTYEENMQLWWGLRGKPAKMPGRIKKTAKLLSLKHKLNPNEEPRASSILDEQFLKAMDTGAYTGRAAAAVTELNDPERIERDESKKSDPSTNVGMLKLPNIFFADGSYKLDPNAKSRVAEIAERLESFPALCIRIYGYTSSSGDPEANKILSKNRAESIASELKRVASSVFPDSRLDVRGFGPQKPVLNRDGSEDADASRRTEFTLYNCAKS